MDKGHSLVAGLTISPTDSVWLSLSFVTGAFGMNVNVLDTGSAKIWQVVCRCCCGLCFGGGDMDCSGYHSTSEGIQREKLSDEDLQFSK
jgi:hypothetical protein